MPGSKRTVAADMIGAPVSIVQEQRRRKYHTLDGMRGVAAILVVMHHGTQFFAPLDFKNSYLAVDLFFMLSGFVIAAAYDGRLSSGRLTPLRFMLVRYIRLWPLYLLGVMMGAVIVHSQVTHGKSEIDMPTFWRVLPLQLFMLPSTETSVPYYTDNVAWSLFFELCANGIYAALHRRLTTPVLLVIAATGAIGVLFALPLHLGINNGWGWIHFWVGFARVAVAFPLGIVLYRHRALLPRFGGPALAILVVLCALLTLPIPAAYNDAFQMLTIVVLFPMLIGAGMQVEPTARWVGVFSWLGITSYAVYTLHIPMLTFFEWALSKIGLVFSDYSPWSGLIAIAVILLVAWLSDRWFDVPVRNWLTNLTRRPADGALRREPTAI